MTPKSGDESRSGASLSCHCSEFRIVPSRTADDHGRNLALQGQVERRARA